MVNPGAPTTIDLNYVRDGWIPPNPEYYAQIQSGLAAGIYDQYQQKLVADLSQDYALFTFVIKQLIEQARSRNPQAVIDPLELLRKAPISDLKKILYLEIRNISHHRYSAQDEALSNSLVSPMIGASIATAAAVQGKSDPELTFLCALLRQIGLTLIAWNYPRIYRHAVAGLHSSSSLDDTLAQMVGFSPSMLGVTLVQNWGLSPEVRAVVGDEQAWGQLSEEQRQISEKMVKLCEIGETLAAASKSDSKEKPTLETDSNLQQVFERFLETMGYEGVSLIWDSIEEHCQSYVKLLPSLISFPEELFSTIPQSNVGSQAKRTENRYIKNCPDSVQIPFAKFYKCLDEGALSKTCVEILVQEIIPVLGFTSGCIYLLDATQNQLAPRFVIGASKIQNFQPVKFSSLKSGKSMLAQAWRGFIPVSNERIENDATKVLEVSGLLGQVHRSGLLCLEMPRTKATRTGESIKAFKAVRQAFVDCLKLN